MWTEIYVQRAKEAGCSTLSVVLSVAATAPTLTALTATVDLRQSPISGRNVVTRN